MPEARLTLSQSSLQDYTDCPRRFRLRYLDELRYPGVESEPLAEYERQQLEGARFHRMAQQFTLGIPPEAIAYATHSPELERWWGEFLSFYEHELGKARGLIPEVSLSAPLRDARLVAKFDLLAMCADGRLRIYDWKTYRKRPRDEWLAARWQMRVYRALLSQAGAQFNEGLPVIPENIEMVYWFANFPAETARFVYTEYQFQRDWDALEKLGAEIGAAAASIEKGDGRFPMTDDLERCAYCPYRAYCARGVQAGGLELIEGESEAEEPFDVDFEQIGEIAF
jgi:hypothetical protein